MVSNPIAIFFHARLSGNGVEFNHASAIFQEIVRDIGASGLLNAASQFVIGVNGEESDYQAACMMSPDKATVIHHLAGVGELPTLKLVQEYATANPTSHICYVHTKGALHSGGTKLVWTSWRHCMSNVVIWNWKECVNDLTGGFDCAGPHWLTPQRYPVIGKVSYFGGNFWWSTARHLNRLPEIDIHASRYEAEVWIGKTSHKIACRPYADHFPMNGCGR